jgi:uncharacterized protein (TIGR02246 family)
MKTRHAVTAAFTLVVAFALVGVVHTATSNATLEQRLQKVEDTEAIRSLLIAYGRALDSRDFKAYGQLFASDGTWKGGMGSATGPQNIATMVAAGFARMSPKLYEKSNHVMTSLDIRVDGDTAKAWSRWLWVVEGEDKRPRVERGGHYEDSLIRENGQWKFKSRQAFTELN